jgi:hypothetical protein
VEIAPLPGYPGMQMSSRLHSIVRTLAALALVSACVAPGCLDSKCYRNEDCTAGQICQTMTGACTPPECTAHSQCAQGRICESYTCVAGCLEDNACDQGKRCVKNRCVVIENQCGCALATRFCLPDIDPVSPSSGKEVCIPDSNPGGTLIFFGSVLCSHCQSYFAQLNALRAKLVAEGLPARIVWSQWSGAPVTPAIVQSQLAGANPVVVQDSAAIGMWPAYHADWYFVSILETHGCEGFSFGPLSESTIEQELATIEAKWRTSMTTACP